MQSVTKLPKTSGIKPDTAILDGWVCLAGKPSMKTWALHTSSDGTMLAGVWECGIGTFHANYTAYEFVHMLEGRIIITPDGGKPVTVKAGDAFVVEADFKGTWKIVEKVRKHFDFRLK